PGVQRQSPGVQRRSRPGVRPLDGCYRERGEPRRHSAMFIYHHRVLPLSREGLMVRVVIVVLLIALLPSLARAEARIALLIGNQRYATEVGPLKNSDASFHTIGENLKIKSETRTCICNSQLILLFPRANPAPFRSSRGLR